MIATLGAILLAGVVVVATGAEVFLLDVLAEAFFSGSSASNFFCLLPGKHIQKKLEGVWDVLNLSSDPAFIKYSEGVVVIELWGHGIRDHIVYHIDQNSGQDGVGKVH